ncbi:hypothetical protein TorRG33x02_047990 [Trema orientale]|uniref:Uncharacterized protein n=1 Tax=Trema orientale TaxID=63057 RepID=A0A2P5FNA8_TREOI|nr:hypothetical protein TorRG33x02_047990 [Trema orientale]
MVGDPLLRESGGGHELHDMEGGKRHVVEVQGAEIRQLLEGGGLGVRVGGLDLAANLVHGFGDEGGLADELEAEALDEVLESSLEEGVHDGRPRHCFWILSSEKFRVN